MHLTSTQFTLSDTKLRRDGEADTDPANGETKFRKLQEKWEHLGRDDSNITSPRDQQTTPTTTPSPSSPSRSTPTNLTKSKIPRPLTSPIKSTTSNLPVPLKSIKSPSGIPSLKKPAVGVVTQNNKLVGQPPKKTPTCKDSPRRTSRLDQENTVTPRPHLTRPSSLPYKTYGTSSKEKSTVSPHRRAASTSLPRPHSIAGPPRNLPPKQTPK